MGPYGGRLRAVIFDFDGVIVDTEPLHYRALAATLAEQGLVITDEEYAHTYIVLDDRNAIRTAFRLSGRDLPDDLLRALMARKAALFEERIEQDAALFPGARECVRALSGELPLAIASGALRSEIVTILRVHGLTDAFVQIVAADDVEHGKPHPETYLRACEAINSTCRPEPRIRPEECVVIEDTVDGVTGAKAARMAVIAVTNSYPPDRLAHADGIVPTLDGLTRSEIERLLQQRYARNFQNSR